MTKCLFVLSDVPISFWHSGSSGRATMDLYALSALGLEIHVLRLLETERRQEIDDYERRYSEETARARSRTSSWLDVEYQRPKAYSSWREAMRRTLFDPLSLTHPEAAAICVAVRSRIATVRPDVIWAEWIRASSGVFRARPDVPWVAVHTDWMFQLMRIRGGSKRLRSRLVRQWLSWSSKRAEMLYLRSCAAVETGSTVQAKEMRSFGLRNVHVIPQAYEASEISLDGDLVNNTPRLVHLGSLETTSNRLGMTAYLDQVHESLSRGLAAQGWKIPFYVVGDITRVKGKLAESLKESGAVCTGFVHDLGSVLRPFDIQIIPYEFSTGLRNKVALLFRYAQVVVSTRAAVAGMPQMANGENCVLVSSLREFPAVLDKLIRCPELRRQYGQNARATFDREFRLEGQLEHYRRMLHSLAMEAG